MAYFKGIRKGKRFWRLLWVGASVSALLLGGCASGSDHKMQSYKNDGYMGYSNSNPNLLGRSGTLYAKDMELIQQVLKPIKGVKKASVGFHGNEVTVTLKLDPGITAVQANQLRTDVQNAVQANLPSYQVRVKANR
ncbi:YhcN/YlaJ family sporulation lipoprotein [Paenibacillus sp. GCM10027627]|uniref:YhcN/YlaJ family sporulation lipoprotein n=1 Tax=unclassified Paenibacillus TaxID=185978 RepID=UPI00362B303A